MIGQPSALFLSCAGVAWNPPGLLIGRVEVPRAPEPFRCFEENALAIESTSQLCDW